ncbi:hypothetical protein ID866_11921 [Astraeus odoratus]|nr:hypothetical protein ID866_11921 [Astraeus odoratus]
MIMPLLFQEKWSCFGAGHIEPGRLPSS